MTGYPIDGQNWLLEGRVKRKLGKYEEAANAYRKAIALLGPGVPWRAQYWLAASEAAGGSVKGALDALDKLVFEQHYGHRPLLYADENFKSLRGEPRFSEIAGHIETGAWTRDEGWRHDIDYLVSEVKRVTQIIVTDHSQRRLTDYIESSVGQFPVLTMSKSTSECHGC